MDPLEGFGITEIAGIWPKYDLLASRLRSTVVDPKDLCEQRVVVAPEVP